MVKKILDCKICHGERVKNVPLCKDHAKEFWRLRSTKNRQENGDYYALKHREDYKKHREARIKYQREYNKKRKKICTK